MRVFPVTLALVLSCCGQIRAADEGQLLHWPCDEGQGAVTRDHAGHALDGTVSTTWTASGSGQAVRIDGTAVSLVRTVLPPDRRLGTGSWTVLLWIKPAPPTIAQPQDRRRFVAYGSYPQAFFCLDAVGSEAVSAYLCYSDAAGKIVGAGTETGTGLTIGSWTHVALTCDRGDAMLRVSLNGQMRAEQRLPIGFAPDFGNDGTFTVGSDWQNFAGDADEIQLFRRALSQAEIRRAFQQLRTAYQVTPSPGTKSADHVLALQERLADADRAWKQRDFAAVRSAYMNVIEDTAAPAAYRSYAHLRSAQSLIAEGRADAAREQLARIAATTAYPPVHRDEASACLLGLERAARGLPARDPEATRVRAAPAPTPGRTFIVAVDGDDAGGGSAARPFATVERALSAARAAGPAAGGTTVILRSGRHLLTSTIRLTAADGGTAHAPLTIRAEQPGRAALYGGVRLHDFTSVTDARIRARLPEDARDLVRQCDLKTLGITDYGSLVVRGFGQPVAPSTLELYVDGRPMTLARWPNQGFVRATRLLEPGSRQAGRPSVIGFEDVRHARWTQARDAWLFGYFRYRWADATIAIAAIDPMAKTLTSVEPYACGGQGMDDHEGIIYHAFNLIEEIDQPGEWYLDRSSGMLYLFPPVDPDTALIELSMLSKPMLSIEGASHIRLEGLVFDLARGDGVILREASDCLVAGCTIRRMAGNGINIHGGQRNLILSCDLHTIGRRASEVYGGDRETLQAAGHVVANCRIHDFGRIDRTYTPGIQLEGVGNRAVHNRLYDCPSSVMRIEGNDHLIEYNEVFDAVRESDDQGAMELYRNPTYRGVVFRHNWFHDLGSGSAQQLAAGQAGIRLDDAISGMLIYGNVFVRAANGVFGAIQINAGRDNVIDNNLFIDCAQGISGGYRAGNPVWKELRTGPWPQDFLRNDLYRSRYPGITDLVDSPGINHAWRNVFVNCGIDLSGNRAGLDLLGNIALARDPGFVDPDQGGLRPQSASIDTAGFHPIPVQEIGLYEDVWQAGWAD